MNVACERRINEICKKTLKRLLNVLAVVSEFRPFDAISWRHFHFRLSLISHIMYALFCLPLWQDYFIIIMNTLFQEDNILPCCPVHQVKNLSPALRMIFKAIIIIIFILVYTYIQTQWIHNVKKVTTAQYYKDSFKLITVFILMA